MTVNLMYKFGATKVRNRLAGELAASTPGHSSQPVLGVRVERSEHKSIIRFGRGGPARKTNGVCHSSLLLLLSRMTNLNLYHNSRPTSSLLCPAQLWTPS